MNHYVFAVEYLIEESVANAYGTRHDENHFKYLLILLLNHIAFGLVLPWFQVFDELNQEGFLCLLMLALMRLLVIQILDVYVAVSIWLKIQLILGQKVIKQIVNDDLTLHVYRQL